MSLYHVTSERLVLAPLGDTVEIEDSVLAARLVSGGHIAPTKGTKSSRGIASDDGASSTPARVERGPSEESGSQTLSQSFDGCDEDDAA